MSSVALLRCTRRTVDLSPYNLNGAPMRSSVCLLYRCSGELQVIELRTDTGLPISSAEQSMNSNAGPVVLLGRIVM